MKKILFLLGVVVIAGCVKKEKPMKKMLNLFVGTYTDGDSEGIYRFNFNTETGELTGKTAAAALKNPSYLAISKNKKNLYAVQETADFDSLGGGLTAFKLKDSILELQSSTGTGGAHPCHVAVSNDKLVVSNYSGGNFFVKGLEDDGGFGTAFQITNHNNVRDTVKTAHAHMAEFVDNQLFVSDLGLDVVKRYIEMDGVYQPLQAQPAISLPEGAGPRHFVFGQNGKFLYVINELNSSISVFEKNGDGVYFDIQNESTLAADFKGESFCADIHVSSDGKFLYGSNRGENTIVIFSIDPQTGRLSLVGREGVKGDWPRNFSLDPTGDFLLVANQRSNNIVVFKRDIEKGTLTFLSEQKLPSPVCLVFL